MNRQSTLESIGKSVSSAIGRLYTPKDARAFGSGGGGASVAILEGFTSNDEDYFVKIAGMGDFDMLKAEYDGVSEIYNSNTIRVPKPICVGKRSVLTLV